MSSIRNAEKKKIAPIISGNIVKLPHIIIPSISNVEGQKKIGSFSLIERVILSAGAMLIFSVYFHLTICPEGRQISRSVHYNLTFWQKYTAYAFGNKCWQEIST
ncbi:hypothetical protein N7536_010894 [Penicillium majusculum]|nr:hypothetical protein N7536_010894 [Penicillium majusculum]